MKVLFVSQVFFYLKFHRPATLVFSRIVRNVAPLCIPSSALRQAQCLVFLLVELVETTGRPIYQQKSGCPLFLSHQE